MSREGLLGLKRNALTHASLLWRVGNVLGCLNLSPARIGNPSPTAPQSKALLCNGNLGEIFLAQCDSTGDLQSQNLPLYFHLQTFLEPQISLPACN